MYTALILGAIIAGVFLLLNGLKRRNALKIAFGGLLVLSSASFFWFLSFWGEMLWFESVGYGQRFWTVITAKAGTAFLGALIGFTSVYFLTFTIRKRRRAVRLLSLAVGAIVGGSASLSNWDTILRFVNRASTGLKDPILGKDTGFYLFALPFYDFLYALFLSLSIISLIAVVVSIFFKIRQGEINFEPEVGAEEHGGHTYGSLYASSAAILFVLAGGTFLDRYHLMYSTWGAVTGAGWTDVFIRLPAYGFVTFITCVLALILVTTPLRERIRVFFQRWNVDRTLSHLFILGATGACIVGIWFLSLSVLPGLFQWLRVEPNEITFEKPFIEHNIRFTRHGFGLHEVEEREFPAAGRFTRQMVEENRSLFSNVRLWDWRALDAVYKQFQEIRLYYEFPDVDIDRYTIDGDYRQVMVSARGLELANLPEDSQTFVNKRFKYTHGYGITLTSVSEFTPEGLPNLLVKDIPPKSEYPELEVERPQIYYGELTQSHVIVNTKEKELDYPSGEENVYIHYPGDGGVLLKNLWRKFLFGWMFDGTRLFLSSYPTAESRIMFHRQIQDRVKTLAPFVHFDDDPYVVLADNKLYWMIDGYTTSGYYPYSEPFSAQESAYRRSIRDRLFSRKVKGQLHGINYIRNSVKAVVDAFDGSVDFYVFEPDDPVIQVWSKIFPDLLKDRQEMPHALLQHVRYPKDMLLVQGLVYAKYHMSDPTVFYNQEDLWIRATEKYYNEVQPVQPYYIMWELPGSDELDFVLILPFTPKNRQVMIGWIAGMCDPDDYGRFLAYKFPKEKRVLGTQQVETKIDQDRFLSGQLTLWDQRGSNVIRGNVLAIPVEDTLLYVEPIYLQAETAAYPELRLVIVMHNDILSYGETFDKALMGIFEDGEPVFEAGEKGMETPATVESLVQSANQAFEDYLKLLGEKRFDEASNSLEQLEKTLNQLSKTVTSASEISTTQ